MVVLLDRPAPETPTLYVPPHAIKNEGEPVLIGEGHKTIEGKWISKRTWVLTNKTNGRTQTVCLLDDEMSEDAVATAYGEARERFLEQTQGLPRLSSYSTEQRKAVGRAINEYRQARKRMAESTNGKIFY